MISKQIIWLMIGLSLIISTVAITPQGNLLMRDLYNITGLVLVTNQQR